MTAQLNIKSAEARELALKISARTGESITEAVLVALTERLRILEKDERLQVIQQRLADTRERWKSEFLEIEHGDLLYDEHGLPR